MASPIIREEHIGDCRLILGDCLEVMPLVGKVDAVVTDPPYGVGFTGKRAAQRGGGTKHRIGGYGKIDDTEEYVIKTAVKAIIWAIKNASRTAVTPGTRCAWHYPKPDDMGCFFSAAGTGVGKWGFTCSQPILYYGKDPFLEHRVGARANSLGQTYPNDANAVAHPCAKPLPQILWLVGRATWATDTVLDPFMGSGTTLIACARLGRKGIGIEIDPDYFDIACKRVDEAYRQPDLFIEPPAKPEQTAMNLCAEENI